ncbi:MAG: cytochrome c peroxidase [Wenzhouxiangellaceae bacterium]|nr:cytochrome c peroxidase [Wenzhouxiangellaceae bacterium]
MNRSFCFRATRLVPIASLMLLASSAATAQDWPSLPTTAPAPADNPVTAAKVELGKMLFFDPRMSSTGTVSCNSCHDIMEGGDDSRPTSFGVEGQLGGRNAPTVWNAAFLSAQFWDGRAPTLEEQAKGPPGNPIEMGMKSAAEAAERIARIPGYRPWFDRAFGEDAEINEDTVAQAIATFERTLITPGSAYDRFADGDAQALTAQQQRGLKTFAETGCTACHSGANFAGPELPAGTGFFQKFPTIASSPYVEKYDLAADRGRAEATGDEADAHRWRVPTLRNIEHTAPYFHNGSVTSLDEAVRVMASTQLNRELDAAAVADIVAFLQALSGPFPEIVLPRLPNAPGDLLQ